MQQKIILLAICAIAAFAIWRPAPRPAFVAAAASSEPTVKPVRQHGGHPGEPAVVYVVGAVRRPGLYRVAQGGRIDDAVRSAGGLLPGADPAAINLAAHVQDGDEIIAPRIGESAPPHSRARSRSAPHKQPYAGVVDVNVASADEIAEVPGIGKTLAARIIEVRERDGVYMTMDELLDVAGMTESRLQKAAPYLRL
jgi:competence protein ComEA